jgi:hypothetical protein
LPTLAQKLRNSAAGFAQLVSYPNPETVNQKEMLKMKAYLVRGVPLSMQRDGWWIGGKGHKEPTGASDRDKPHPHGPLAMLFALIFVGDVLLWPVNAGLSIAVFWALVVLGAWAVTGQKLSGRKSVKVVCLTILAILPAIEHVQLLSMLWLFVGIGMALVVLVDIPLKQLPAGFLRLCQWGPVQGFIDMRTQFRAAPKEAPKLDKSALNRFALGWGLPLGLGLVFVSLLIDANPMLEDLVFRFDRWTWQIDIPVDRIVFWLGLAFMLWPALALMRMRARLQNPIGLSLPKSAPAIFNAASVTRSLILFNVIFAVQTVLDVTYLYSGFSLPDGMTYAEYAHRGAYPLIVTALLAGLFALISRPFTKDAPVLRVALMVWVVQNVLLVVSSIYRLELYVEVYGLTRLRIAAFIWMAVVAVGLMLTLWQIWRHHSGAWLLTRAALVGAGALYGASFLDFDAQIGRYNLTQDVELDRHYLCSLSPSVGPAIYAYQRRTGRTLCYYRSDAPLAYIPQYAAPKDWREWGFRVARVRHTLTTLKAEGL